MITEYHFPTPVYIQEIPNAVELNQHLEKNILQWNKEDPKGVSKTNVNGWHSATNMNEKKEYNPLMKELFAMQDKIFTKEFLTLKPVLGNMWANINYKGGFNRPHLHPNALFSGVYWIKAPEKSGDLMLYVQCLIEKKESYHHNYGERYIIHLKLEGSSCFLLGFGMK